VICAPWSASNSLSAARPDAGRPRKRRESLEAGPGTEGGVGAIAVAWQRNVGVVGLLTVAGGPPGIRRRSADPCAPPQRGASLRRRRPFVRPLLLSCGGSTAYRAPVGRRRFRSRCVGSNRGGDSGAVYAVRGAALRTNEVAARSEANAGDVESGDYVAGSPTRLDAALGLLHRAHGRKGRRLKPKRPSFLGFCGAGEGFRNGR
jgi:hypothetical protein